MLVRFEVTNFRSIAAPVELSMVAVDRDRPAARDQPMLGESLLPVAAVYGPNASGKSNVAAALRWLRDAVAHSLRTWEEDIPTEPFAFGPWPSRPTEFAYEAVIDGVRFEYLLELNARRVEFEALFHYPEKKRRRIFERVGTELKLQRGLGALSGTRELLTDRTLALSVARRFDEPLVSSFADELIRIAVEGLFAQPKTWHQRTVEWFEAGDDRSQSLALLRLADLGIDDVVLDAPERGLRRIWFVHNTAAGSAPLNIIEESKGTLAWFRLIGPVLTALRHGSLLLCDELDASLHPTLSAQLIDLFHDPVINPRGAQLVFTSHDTSLLNHLNRDEVWLTEKNPDGSTRLGALADFAGERVRKSQNLETAYLHGRFGALPQPDRAELLRELGLAG
ncbi:AAA family ATPase [Kutzneria sp. CA-103260]|uniref:AAA family ATPase n=1 Tax=Kutzneria sp. CA-103260 TaxID=2802641 RepID=UPI001BA91FFB|nr:ATP-binding protein [Kutzneria sp. CA-103260]QUQ63082.1 AAA domain, putative AbiEii toxin, Type IV TA system [Kutzneria sp. CA-103260]